MYKIYIEDDGKVAAVKIDLVETNRLSGLSIADAEYELIKKLKEHKEGNVHADIAFIILAIPHLRQALDKVPAIDKDMIMNQMNKLEPVISTYSHLFKYGKAPVSAFPAKARYFDYPG